MAKAKSASRIIAEKTVFAMFKILKEGGQMPGREVIDRIRKVVTFNDYETHIFEKTGYVRWESVLHFYTIDCIKAGLMTKENGLWALTEEGQKAIKIGPEGLFDLAKNKYKEWSAGRGAKEGAEIISADEEIVTQNAILSQFEDKATDGIREYILAKGPYDFQQLVSFLLAEWVISFLT